MFSPAEIKLKRDSNAIAEEEHLSLSDWRNTRLRLALVYVLAIGHSSSIRWCLMPRTGNAACHRAGCSGSNCGPTTLARVFNWNPKDMQDPAIQTEGGGAH